MFERGVAGNTEDHLGTASILTFSDDAGDFQLIWILHNQSYQEACS